MAKENKQLIKTWEDRYQDHLNSGLSIHKWCTLKGSFGQDPFNGKFFLPSLKD